MKATRKVPTAISASENKFVQKKLDEANAALKRMDVSVFERKATSNQKNAK